MKRNRLHLRALVTVLCCFARAQSNIPDTYPGIFDFDGPADPSPRHFYERQRFDGWFNNMAHPEWGSNDNRLTRKAPAAYADGVYMMAGADRPSPRKLSEAFMKGEDGLPSLRNRTALLAFFGQVVTAEILMASENGCPLEIHRIEIDKCDEMYDEDCRGSTFMPFYRAQYDPLTGQSPNMPREQINRMTTWIDGSFIYSHQEAWVSTMRSFKNGSLKWMAGAPGMPPYNVERVPLFNSPIPHVMRRLNLERMFVLGDPRTNQNPAFLTLGILFYRWHNVLATRIQNKHPQWNDEDVFQAARRVNIATLQSIIAYEYIPAFLGEELRKYNGYNPDIHPGISHVFSSAAFRYGHTLIPPGIYRRDGQCNFKEDFRGSPALRLCSTWWDAQGVLTNMNDNKDIIEDILRGVSSQISEREDSFLCSDVRNKLFGPMDFSRRDLASINIMRGRDNGLPDYNTVRKTFNLPRVSNWSQINPQLYKEHPELFESLETIYGSDCLTNIDLYIGGMLESNDDPGPLFRAIIKDQFERLRDGDRFWFENLDNGIFSPEEIERLKGVSLWDVIVNASSVKADEIQKNVFFWLDNDPCHQPTQLKASGMPSCEYLRGHNAFQGSETAYLYGLVFFVFFPVFCACAGYGLIKLTNGRRRRARTNQPNANCFKKNGTKTNHHLRVREWVEPNKSRPVRVLFGLNGEVTLTNRKSDILRKVNLNCSDNLMVEVTRDAADNRPMILMKIPESYDLVLEFDSEPSRKRFLVKIESFVSGLRKSIEMVPVFKRPMLVKAETKERRQKRLEHFFREAYALTFGLRAGEKRKPSHSNDDSVNVMRTALTRDEFANALGMRTSDFFVKKMFKIVDKDHDERISFQEFLDTVVLFSTSGTSDDKIRIIFDMCDTNENGVIEKSELQEMLISLVEMAKTDKVLTADVDKLIDSMFETSGFQDKEVLTYEDFQSLMQDFNGDFLTVGLDCKGANHNFLDTTTNIARMQTFAMEYRLEHTERGYLRKKWDRLTTFLEENRQHIFYLLTFFSMNVYLFSERFIHYCYMTEHADLRHIMGVGIAITRGCAAALSFDYSILLLSMSRNLLTKLKESSFHQYIPIDSHLQFHKICACTALFFSFLHSVGHLVNFYQVASQPLEHLSCLSPELSFPSDMRPTIPYWLFQTLTGLTGILLYAIVCIIFMFAHPIVRRKAYRFFWLSHQLYVVFYILCLLHGLQRITSVPRFWVFFIFPGAIFIFDKIESLRRSYMELDILETEILPSDVIKITFYRPPNFTYRSGQWIRVSCNVVGYSEYHSLTITSAPHEDFLSIHIKARGPWTWRLRNYFDSSNLAEEDSKGPEDEDAQKVKGDGEDNKENDGQIHPRIRLQGPYGGGNQEWYKFEVAVMIGAGIGVTPYASILNDLVFGTSTNRYSGVACKKVYFLWITPSHRSFEWFMDVLRDVEQKDVTNVLEMHIFITQFFHKYDLRTTMLYICENHFQRLSRTSLFTNLKAANHFGRPDMASFLRFVQRKHSYVSKVGVFSCGPNPVIKGISAACEEVNRTRKLPYFSHHFENFC